MNRVYLVTGAGGRLGRALCERMSVDGRVVAAYRTNLPACRSQLRQPVSFAGAEQREHGEVFCVQADVSSVDDVKKLIDLALARFDRIDVIVNAAADTHFYGGTLDLIYRSSDELGQLRTNVFGPALVTSAVFHAFWKHEGERNADHLRSVVNISSHSATSASSRGGAFYALSKAALNMLTLHMSMDLAPYGVRVNALCPPKFTTHAAAEKVAIVASELSRAEETGQLVAMRASPDDAQPVPEGTETSPGFHSHS